jgi:mRNA-degrading endonuclease RelE of RelBE toxin-antitoxin system
MRYSSKQYSYSIAVHDDAALDIDKIYLVDEDAAADIEVFLEEAQLNQKILDSLTINKYVTHEALPYPYDVKELIELKKKKLNIWRVRLLQLNSAARDYRIIYAFNPPEMRYYVLGVVHRQFNYDITHEITKRIVAAYDNLPITRI